MSSPKTAGAASRDETSKSSIVNENLDVNSITDPDNDYMCEYSEDIWKSLLQQEAETPPIHLQSPQLKFRGTLVEQLRDVTKMLGLSLATLHSAVAHLDLFMDAHRLRGDRLTHVALACLSLAAKSEEKYTRAPTLKTLSLISGVHLCGETFRQLEWMVGQHIKWRLLAPTPVTFAALLAQYMVTDDDLVDLTRHPKFVRRLKHDAGKMLNAYLDLTLADVRLQLLESAIVGCACVSCARADLGLSPWVPELTALSARQYTTIAPVAQRLHRMMEIVRERAKRRVKSEVDQGYGSAKTTPNQTPNTSPVTATKVSPPTSTLSSISNDDNYRHLPAESRDYSVLDMNDSDPLPPPPEPFPADVRIPTDYKYARASLLLNAVDSVQPATSVAVKRGPDDSVDFENKRYRLSAHMSQVVL